MEIKVTLKNYRCFSDGSPAIFTLHGGFTAFVGINNSGKSTLLKFFYEFRNLFGNLAYSGSHYQQALQQHPMGFSWPTELKDPEEPFCDRNTRDMVIDFKLTIPDNGDVVADRFVVDHARVTIKRATSSYVIVMFSGGHELAPGPDLYVDGTKLTYQHPTEDNRRIFADISKVLEAFRRIANTLYIPPFRNAVNVGSMLQYFDMNIGEAFIREWSSAKTGGQKKLREAMHQLTDDVKRLFRFDDLKIDASDDKQTLIITIDGKSYKLSDVGSGIAQFILVLAIAARKAPNYILIDEPELNLHPALQLDFLTTLGSYATEGGVLFATHSLGLARASAQHIYSIQKTSKHESKLSPYESTPRLSELVGELSFSGHKELGFEKILLVEGSTEVLVFQQWLRIYGKDHQVVILPMGGSQLIRERSEAELQEIKRISDQVFAIIDSERTDVSEDIPPDRTAFAETCKKVGIECHILTRRATENYFTDDALKATYSNNYKSLEPYQKLKAASPSWPKADNWKIARRMRMDELDNTDLGEFLAAI